MKVQKLSIKNVLGLENLEIQPGGGVTVISGKNGEGKSTILKAIESASKGGAHQAELIRQGSDGAEIVLVLDDGLTLTKKINGDKSTVDLRDQGGKLGSPGTRIKSFFDSVGVNPIEVLTCSDKDRAKILLDAIGAKADKAKLLELSGVQVSNDDALLAVEEARKDVYDQRTQINAEAKAAKASAQVSKQDAEALPVEAVDLVALNAEIEKIEAWKSEEASKILPKYAEKQREIYDQIGKMRAEIKRLEDSIVSKEAMIDEFKKMESLDFDSLARDAAQKAAPIKQEIANASQVNSSVKLRESLLARARVQVKEAEQKEEVSKALTAKTEALDSYKKELLASLPIEGVSVEGGEIHVDGIPFSTLNNAKRVEFALRVAMLRAGDVKIVCLDNSELLDRESFQALTAEIEAKGFQAFVTRVSDGPLTISGEP